MGMTLNTTPVGTQSAQWFNGHVYIDLWNSFGTHNTFGKWPSESRWEDTCDYHGNNDICDKDDNQVNAPWELIHLSAQSNPYGNSGNSYFKNSNFYYKKTLSSLSKPDWDYIVFGSGYRSNYKYDGTFIDLGGQGTYNYNASMSRFDGYPSRYDLYGTNFCSTYAMSFWRNFRSSNSSDALRWYSGAVTPTGIYNALSF
jgi:hypothetical protein